MTSLISSSDYVESNLTNAPSCVSKRPAAPLVNGSPRGKVQRDSSCDEQSHRIVDSFLKAHFRNSPTRVARWPFQRPGDLQAFATKHSLTKEVVISTIVGMYLCIAVLLICPYPSIPHLLPSLSPSLLPSLSPSLSLSLPFPFPFPPSLPLFLSAYASFSLSVPLYHASHSDPLTQQTPLFNPTQTSCSTSFWCSLSPASSLSFEVL